MSYTGERARIVAEISSHHYMLDDRTSACPQLWRGVDWEIDLGFFLNGVLVGVTGLSALTLDVRPIATPGGSNVATKTVSSFDNTTTQGTWDDGTKQHAQFLFPASETNISLGGTASAKFFVSVWGLTTDIPAKVVVAGITVLEVFDAYINAGGIPTPDPDGYYTTVQSDARYMQSVSVVAPLESTGGKTPTLSVAAGTVSGQVLTWNGSAWVAGAVAGVSTMACAEDSSIHAVDLKLENGYYIFRVEQNPI